MRVCLDCNNVYENIYNKCPKCDSERYRILKKGEVVEKPKNESSAEAEWWLGFSAGARKHPASRGLIDHIDNENIRKGYQCGILVMLLTIVLIAVVGLISLAIFMFL